MATWIVFGERGPDPRVERLSSSHRDRDLAILVDCPVARVASILDQGGLASLTRVVGRKRLEVFVNPDAVAYIEDYGELHQSQQVDEAA